MKIFSSINVQATRNLRPAIQYRLCHVDSAPIMEAYKTGYDAGSGRAWSFDGP